MTDLRKAAEMALEVMEYNRANGTPNMGAAIEALRQALAQPEQEPVAWGMRRKDGVILDIKNADFEHEGYEKIYTVPLYTAPPKREWVGLTDEEIKQIELSLRQYNSRDTYDLSLKDFAKAIEAKLKEKNGG